MVQDQIIKIIDARFIEKNFNVSSLAEALGYSTSYIREICYSNFNNCPQKILEARRLLHALEILHSSNEKLYIVSNKSGFSTMRNFRKSFVKHTGYCPSKIKFLLGRDDELYESIKKSLTRDSALF